MFNLSMPELAVIGVVALLVLGPERLPGAARTVGALMRRAQRSWTGLRADIERELAADELKRHLKQAQDDIGLESVKRDLDDARNAIVRDLDPRPAPSQPSAPSVSFPGSPIVPPAADTGVTSSPSPPGGAAEIGSQTATNPSRSPDDQT